VGAVQASDLHVTQDGNDSNPGTQAAPLRTILHAAELRITLDPSLKSLQTAPVTTERLGKALITGCTFENPDGSPVQLDVDSSGKPRNAVTPTAGPFENPGAGKLMRKVW